MKNAFKAYRVFHALAWIFAAIAFAPTAAAQAYPSGPTRWHELTSEAGG